MVVHEHPLPDVAQVDPLAHGHHEPGGLGAQRHGLGPQVDRAALEAEVRVAQRRRLDFDQDAARGSV